MNVKDLAGPTRGGSVKPAPEMRIALAAKRWADAESATRV